MSKDKKFGERVAFLRNKLGIKQTDAATDIRVSYGSYQRFEGGGRPNERNLQKLIDYFGCRREWLLTGEGATYQRDAADDLGIISVVTLGEREYIMVPKAVQKPGAGAGLVVLTEDMEGERYAFRHEWLKKVASSPRRALLMEVVGDSMEPMVSDGDMIMIDRGRRDIISGKIYLIGIGNEVLIKYLEMRPGGNVLIKSANPRYDPFTARLDDIRIIGQVIWSAKSLI